MLTDCDLYILDQINVGLRADIQQLHKIDKTIVELLDEARTFPGLQVDAASPEWQQLLTDLEAIRSHVHQVDATLTTSMDHPQEDWNAIQEIDLRLENQLTHLRDTGAQGVPPDRQMHWDDLWRSVFLHLGSVRAHAAVIQAKGEMRTRYGPTKAEGITEDVLSRLPADVPIGDAARYAEEYRRALRELQENKEKTGGFFDIVKALFMVPDEDPDMVARRRMNDTHRD